MSPNIRDCLSLTLSVSFGGDTKFKAVGHFYPVSMPGGRGGRVG